MPSTMITRLSDSDSLLTIMIKMEDYLDNLDLYVYKNWIDGELVAGPHITRYWASMTLMYDYKDMPDPAGGLRLMKHGAIVKYQTSEKEDNTMKINMSPAAIGDMMANQYGTADQPGNANTTPSYITNKLPRKKVWLVEIFIPRQFIDDAFDMDLGTLVADEQMSADSNSAKNYKDDNTDSNGVPGPAVSNNSTGMMGGLSEPNGV